MTTSHDVSQTLLQAIERAREATRQIDNLIAEHDYQDVIALTTQAATDLLEAAEALIRSDQEPFFEHLENAEDLLNAVYDIIDGEVDDEE